MDDIDNRIVQARTALSEVTKDLQERIHRWSQIEQLCGFGLVHNSGLAQLQKQLNTGSNSASTSSTASLLSQSTLSLTRNSSESTLFDPETEK